MFPLFTSWKRMPWRQRVAPAALVLLVTALVLVCVWIGLSLQATIRRQRHGETQALTLAELEARTLNELAATNRTIAATYVVMNHMHASTLAAPGTQEPGAVPVVERSVDLLDQMMDAARSAQCTRFAVTFGEVRLTEAGDMERTVGEINAAEFSEAMEGMPCGAPERRLETERAGCALREGCFSKFRFEHDSGHGCSQYHVYRYLPVRRLAGAEEEKSSLFMAHVGYQAPDTTQEPPNMFASSWRATLPEGPFRSTSTPGGLELGPGLFEKEHGKVRLEVVRRATQGMPSYKGERLQALAADFLGEGSSIAAGWFMTRDTPEQVLGFYREGLGRTGLPVLFHHHNPSAGYVGYRDPETQALHLVSVLAQGAETTVLVSHASADAVTGALQGPLPPELPMPKAVQQHLVMSFQDEGPARFTGHVSAPHARVEGLADLFRQEFKRRGWSVEQGSEQLDEEVLLSARRGSARVSILIQPQASGAQAFFTMERS
ncbi:hypothetical protein [Hyalangium gracile]|uniref:hypothetical protein n=1 Tax=Hyalangium gracile TaxID=394092 RepID=UPI001CCABC5D|nr:hypothetical protein [Hyalangium gracile]